MKTLTLFLFSATFAMAAPTDDFIAKATQTHGTFGEKAARFLVEHMSDNDKQSLSTEFLTENLHFALKARATFPWAKDVPEDIFLNDVLPYAVFDEPRDPWRAEFLEKATPLVKDAKTASEAVQILNRDFSNSSTPTTTPNASARISPPKNPSPKARPPAPVFRSFSSMSAERLEFLPAL